MYIAPTEIAKVAHLARLSVTETEISAFVDKLTDILKMIEQIQAIPTEHIEPMTHPLPGLVQRLRPDTVTEANVQDAMLSLSQKTQAGLYLVPSVLETSA